MAYGRKIQALSCIRRFQITSKIPHPPFSIYPISLFQKLLLLCSKPLQNPCPSSHTHLQINFNYYIIPLLASHWNLFSTLATEAHMRF